MKGRWHLSNITCPKGFKHNHTAHILQFYPFTLGLLQISFFFPVSSQEPNPEFMKIIRSIVNMLIALQQEFKYLERIWPLEAKEGDSGEITAVGCHRRGRSMESVSKQSGFAGEATKFPQVVHQCFDRQWPTLQLVLQIKVPTNHSAIANQGQQVNQQHIQRKWNHPNWDIRRKER